MMRENFMRDTFAAFRGVPQRMKFYAGKFKLTKSRWAAVSIKGRNTPRPQEL